MQQATTRRSPTLSPEECTAFFWTQVKKMPSGCWEWTATKLPKGYGRATAIEGGRQRYAHRMAWELTYGPIPDGLFVCHHCDNPPCCNPEHLFLGTILDNNQDCARKGRHYSHFKGVTHCKRGHEFTPENTYRSKAGRVCRACTRMHGDAYLKTERGKELARLRDLNRTQRRQALRQAGVNVSV